MIEPVNRRDNPAIREFFEDHPTGPSANEVKISQRPGHQAGEVLLDLGKEVGEHTILETALHGAEVLAEHVGEGFAHAVKIGGPIVSGLFATKALFEAAVVKPGERGEEIARGLASDQGRLAGVLVAQVADPTLLPNGYAESLKGEVVGSGSFYNSRAFIMATGIQVGIGKGAPDAIAFRDQLVSSIRAGIDAAHLYHIDSPSVLDRLREQSGEFQIRYQTDPGFQIGVRAALWQAQIFPDDFSKAERDRGLHSATIQLSQGA